MNLSIVIPSRHRVDLLRACLESVAAYAPNGTQILVVDDGSEGAVVSQLAKRFRDVESIRLKTSAGFCVAANRGITAARGEIVELLNDDTEVTPGWAEAALRRFENSEVVAVAPLVLQHEGNIQHTSLHKTRPRIDSAGDVYDPGGFAFKRGHGELFTVEGRYAVPVRVSAVSAAAGFYRREALLSVGMFPETFQAYFDDVDLSCRLNRIGSMWYEPESVVWHHVSASYGRTANPVLVRMQSRNEELLFWRNRSGSWTIVRHAGVLVLKALRRTREGSIVPWAKGRFRAWHELMNSRAEMPSNRADS